jgi:hypothetical protein
MAGYIFSFLAGALAIGLVLQFLAKVDSNTTQQPRKLMNIPTTYTPEQIRSELMTSVTAGLPDGRWVAARPMGWQGLGIKARCNAAWMVFTGRWDALRWEGQ